MTVKLESRVWTNGLCELFDYECGKYTSQNLTISNTGKLFKGPSDLEFHTSNHKSLLATVEQSAATMAEPYTDLLALIQEDKDGIKAIPQTADPFDGNSLWQVVQTSKGCNGQLINGGDFLKLGKTYIKVTKIGIKNQEDRQDLTPADTSSPLRQYLMQTDHKLISVSNGLLTSGELNNQNYSCKICLCQESEEKDDPLISPCGCTGSIQYVHLKCLQKWIQSRIDVHESKNIVTLFWKSLKCELCKADFPLGFHQNGQDFDLIALKDKITPSSSYVVLEICSSKGKSRGIYIVNFNNNQVLKLGRGRDSDIKIPDISISRTHGYLTIVKDQLYLKDNSSKFGTLIFRKEPVLLNEKIEKSPMIQCGKMTFQLTLKKPWTWNIPCFGSCIETDSFTGKRALKAGKALEIHSEITIKVHSETIEIKKSE